MTADIPPNTMLWDGPAAARSVAADLIDKSRTSFETTGVTEKGPPRFSGAGEPGAEKAPRGREHRVDGAANQTAGGGPVSNGSCAVWRVRRGGGKPELSRLRNPSLPSPALSTAIISGFSSLSPKSICHQPGTQYDARGWHPQEEKRLVAVPQAGRFPLAFFERALFHP